MSPFLLPGSSGKPVNSTASMRSKQKNQFEDNKSNTRVYKPGTVVPFHVDLVAHHTGYAVRRRGF